MNKIIASKAYVKELPDSSGVYMYRDAREEIIYVGKAKNLRNRVGSYFSLKLEPKTARMVSLAKTLNYIPVESEFEALLLEAKLVRKHRPKYNIELRDDKSPLYIGITKEDLPRIILLRQREIDKFSLRDLFGPFVNTTSPKWVLRNIRKVFPYSTHKPTKRPCVYHQIGLCNPCPSEIIAEGTEESKKALKREYMLNVRRVKAVLSGKSRLVLSQLERDMKEYSKKEDFENAKKVKKQIEDLTYTVTRRELNNSYIENPNLLDDIRARELRVLRKYISRYYPETGKISRIECFDIAHLSGTYPTASMVTFIDGEPDKSYYRHFKMHNNNSDVDNMREVLRRRKKWFSKWGRPDLIIVDGGKPQISAAIEEIDEVPVIGLAKKEETLVFKVDGGFYELKLPDGSAKKLVQRLRDEAHRFARRYHHKLVSRAIKEA